MDARLIQGTIGLLLLSATYQQSWASVVLTLTVVALYALQLVLTRKVTDDIEPLRTELRELGDRLAVLETKDKWGAQ